MIDERIWEDIYVPEGYSLSDDSKADMIDKIAKCHSEQKVLDIVE